MSSVYAVTGVSSGIGAAIARALKSEGEKVIGFDVRETDENVDEFITLDLSNPHSIARAAAAVNEPLDGLCNNAGLPPRSGLEPIILQVNFLGQRQFTNAMLPHLKKGSSIVNMASRAGAAWRDNLDQNKRLASMSTLDELREFVETEKIDATRLYNLSKEAVILWTLAMTEELIDMDLRANSVSPGAISTGILDDFARAFGKKMARNLERAGRPGTPDEVAEIVVFLLSKKSSWIKGADIPVDGGIGGLNVADALQLHGMKYFRAEHGGRSIDIPPP